MTREFVSAVRFPGVPAASNQAAIEAALPGQLGRRAKDAAAHRALNVREAKRMASTFVAEDKWRRDWRVWG